MTPNFFPEYEEKNLSRLIEDVNTSHYDRLRAMCHDLEDALERLRHHDFPAEAALYMSLAEKLREQVDGQLNWRSEIFVPYVHDLYRKNEERHDCSQCSGGCNIGHTSRLLSLKESHQKIKELLYRLQMVALPLYSDTKFPKEYKQLRDAIMLMDTELTRLFYLEESVVVPGIKEMQKQIHADDK